MVDVSAIRSQCERRKATNYNYVYVNSIEPRWAVRLFGPWVRHSGDRSVIRSVCFSRCPSIPDRHWIYFLTNLTYEHRSKASGSGLSVDSTNALLPSNRSIIHFMISTSIRCRELFMRRMVITQS